MAGIYIHIPFCKKACNYCDFHFSTSFKFKDDLIECIKKEISTRKNYLNNQKIESVYFGGGTPSVLNEKELTSILETIYNNFEVIKGPEITLEANPDDLSKDKLKMLKKIGVNRLSIGIQSFIEKDLQFMNRSHSVNQATESVKYAQEIGFNNITIDLIYGIPNLTDREWENNIQKAIKLGVNHISAYCLTSENKTAMHHDIAKGKYQLPCEDITSQQFETLINKLKKSGFEQYEISNFAKKDFYSKHNSSYWKQKLYLGIGPSAHSFDGNSRQWNIANNVKYIKGGKSNLWDFEKETLNEKTKYNEYVLTSLRTSWGINLSFLKENFDQKFTNFLLKNSNIFIEKNQISHTKNVLKLTEEGKLLADYIASELFWV